MSFETADRYWVLKLSLMSNYGPLFDRIAAFFCREGEAVKTFPSG
jgi:hypothetical protein